MTMQERAFGFLSSLFKQQTPLDPAVFGDPLAQATQWAPLVSGGASFCTHRLKKIDPMTMEFKPTFGMKLFCSFFSCMGFLFAFGPLGAIYKQYGGFHWSMLLTPLFGLVFFVVGVAIYYVSSRPIIFDMKRRVFCKGFKTSNEPSRFKKGISVDMNRIRALQVLSEYCHGNKSSYYSYELNLVLDDASRVNVVDHGNLKALREDARVLGQFLGLQVWDVEAARAGSLKKDTGFFPDKWV